MLNFCTLFDSNYLSRGLAMYESLKQHCKCFHLFIFPFNGVCLDILSSLNLDNVTLVPLNIFENEKLLSVKNTRTPGEYCWTCTPWVIHFVLKNFNVKECTYLDADLYFFSSPEVLLEELGNEHVIITEHNYSEKYKNAYIHGRFCVQFLTVKNDDIGKKVLEDWGNNCLKWCYNRVEGNKFGDQKYLNAWPDDYMGIHILKNEGGGLAPWNIQQYKILSDQDCLKIYNEKSKQTFKVVFYHFHALNFYNSNLVKITSNYRIKSTIVNRIYLPYIKHLNLISEGTLGNYTDVNVSGVKYDSILKVRLFFEYFYELLYNFKLKQKFRIKIELLIDFILMLFKLNCYNKNKLISKWNRLN